MPTRINNNHRKLICISSTIYDLSVWNKPLIDTCHYCLTSRANQALRSLANTGFQNWGVCLQAFPSFPSPLFHILALVSFLAWPKPRILFLGLSLLQNQIETLATQVRIAMMLHWLSQPFYVFETSIVNYQSSKGQVKGLFILTHDSIRPYLTISERTCILTVQLAQPIRCYVHWRTQVFKIEGFVCKPFLPYFYSPSPPPPRTFIFWLSFHFSCEQNRESRSSIFLYSKTKRKHLLRRLESHLTLAFSPLLYLLETSIVPYRSSKVRVKGLFLLARDSIRPYYAIRKRTCILTFLRSIKSS